jgi:hypothetical protein
MREHGGEQETKGRGWIEIPRANKSEKEEFSSVPFLSFVLSRSLSSLLFSRSLVFSLSLFLSFALVSVLSCFVSSSLPLVLSRFRSLSLVLSRFLCSLRVSFSRGNLMWKIQEILVWYFRKGFKSNWNFSKPRDWLMEQDRCKTQGKTVFMSDTQFWQSDFWSQIQAVFPTHNGITSSHS